jgi:hypothetical protein
LKDRGGSQDTQAFQKFHPAVRDSRPSDSNKSDDEFVVDEAFFSVPTAELLNAY